ncbi:hypothetical protein VNO78_01017 [Psophocarpus tetragonolobus]|uniref:Uncharacterized protein n=1 Tax=Psophocarpus tetragonolobus TaxID=3891 RepID=A0AAN9T155_PSOTE
MTSQEDAKTTFLAEQSGVFGVKFLQAASNKHSQKMRQKHYVFYLTLFGLYILNFPKSDSTMHCIFFKSRHMLYAISPKPRLSQRKNATLRVPSNLLLVNYFPEPYEKQKLSCTSRRLTRCMYNNNINSVIPTGAQNATKSKRIENFWLSMPCGIRENKNCVAYTDKEMLMCY